MLVDRVLGSGVGTGRRGLTPDGGHGVGQPKTKTFPGDPASLLRILKQLQAIRRVSAEGVIPPTGLKGPSRDRRKHPWIAAIPFHLVARVALFQKKERLLVQPSFREMVGARGFEPPTSRSRTVRSTRLSHAPNELRF